MAKTKKKKATKPREKYEYRGRDVAHILDMSPDDVLELARKGSLKGKRDGRFWRFRRPDILAYKKEKGLQGG